MNHRLTAFVLVFAAAACSNNSPPVVGGRLDASDVGDDFSDVATKPPADVAPDLTVDVPDDRAMDVTQPDAPPDGPPPCTSSADCASMTETPVCDTATGRCVACVATADTCPAAQHCNATLNRCEAGCRSDEGCPRPSGADDGGVPVRTHCDTSLHMCAECLSDDHCAPGTLCVGNVCAPGCSSARACPTGQTCCAGGCVDAQTNLAHCGACDRRCAAAMATPACLNGTCSVGACTAPFGDCDADVTNGCEVDTQRDLAHCGACGTACPMRANAAATCDSGRCGFACSTGFADCDGDVSNGCEVDTRTSASSCGSCRAACTPPNATPACADGRCAIASCADGFGDCDMNASNGCETATRTSVTHCGMCGTACPERPNAFPGCVAARCVISCVAGFADCDGDASNGCEVDTRVDRSNCGACGRACTTSGGTGACTGSVCNITGCDPGRGDCDGMVSTGCEVDLTAAVAHCGACGTACPARANASSTCARGACGIACNPGFGDCDADATNGCETALDGATHCGRCGNVCASATPVCMAATCVTGCPAGQVRCSGACVNTQSEPAHCGACGAACPAAPESTRACASGRCGFLCNAGRGDCDGTASNGCESTFATDGANCGACGRACGSSAACRDGMCVSTLPAGLLAWYRFEEGTGTLVLDSSGNAFHGTHTASYGPGRLGGALVFNGSTRATVPGSTSFTWGNANADFTEEYWLYVTTAATGSWRNITHKGATDCSTTDRTSAQWLGPSSMNIYPAISTVVTCNDYFVGPLIPLNTWVHVADVKQGSTHTLYVDGAIVTMSTVGSTVGNTGPFYMGGDPFWSGMHGRLDEVRIYTRALTPLEIAADIRATGGP